MLTQRLHTVVLIAMLAVVVSVVSIPEAQAMGAGCCCPADACGCGCAQHGQEEGEPAFVPPASEDSGTCSCSTGSNPFNTDETVVAVWGDPPQKRFFQPLAASVDGVCLAPAGLSLKRYKPPAVTHRCLYLLKSTFLI